ncbi:hypothetical protein V1477_013650 [Vespula maculifrons]|uniref:Uncharacterized protein n=1 Tax=Vespula maculifrons TaxID=7453 RepID=A0ABD2BNV2_VESMC
MSWSFDNKLWKQAEKIKRKCAWIINCLTYETHERILVNIMTQIKLLYRLFVKDIHTIMKLKNMRFQSYIESFSTKLIVDLAYV